MLIVFMFNCREFEFFSYFEISVILRQRYIFHSARHIFPYRRRYRLVSYLHTQIKTGTHIFICVLYGSDINA